MTMVHITVGEVVQRMTGCLYDAQVERVLSPLNFDVSIYTEVQKSACLSPALARPQFPVQPSLLGVEAEL